MQSFKKIGTILKQHPWLYGLGMVAVLIVFMYPAPAHAWPITGSFSQEVSDLLVGLFGAILDMLGNIINKIIYLLIIVATYDNFGTSPAVASGWVIVRDLANMAIVVALLYIAFANALGKGKYSLDQALMRLVGVAILVNFSKTLTLMLVDVSQVVMMTFVNAFKDVGAGNFTQIMGVEKFGKLANTLGDVALVLGGLIFNIVIMLVVIAVLVVMVGILIVRIVSIWLFIVIAPAAFMGIGSSVPFADKIWSQWWSKFQEYLLIGPCIAFFIWLTFTTLQSGNTAQSPAGGLADKSKFVAAENVTKSDDLGKIGTMDTLAGFAIAVAMLLGGVTLCAKMASGVPGVGGLKPSALKKGITTGLSVGRDVVAGIGRRTSALGAVVAGGKDAGRFRKFAGGALQTTGKVTGRAVATTKFVEDFVKEPGTLARGIYRQAIKGEGGAIKTAISTTQQSGLKSAQEQIKKEGRSQAESKIALKDLANRTDLTSPQRLAEFLAAIENDALGSPSEKEGAWKQIKSAAKGRGENMQFYDDQEVKWRKTAYDEKSIYRKPLTGTDKDGKYGARENTLEKNFERAGDLTHLNMADKLNKDELNLEKISAEKDANGKSITTSDGKLKFNNDDEVFQNQKATLLGINETALAKNQDEEFKASIREQLIVLAKNADLTEEEKGRTKRLLAASHAGGAELTTASAEQIKKAIDDVENNKTGKEEHKLTMQIATDVVAKAPKADSLVQNKVSKMIKEVVDEKSAASKMKTERDQKVDVIITKGIQEGASDKDILVKLKTNDPAYDLDDKTFKAAKTKVTVKLAQDEVIKAVPNTAGANIEESIKKAIADYLKNNDKDKIGGPAHHNIGQAQFEVDVTKAFEERHQDAGVKTTDEASIKAAVEKAAAEAATAASAKAAEDLAKAKAAADETAAKAREAVAKEWEAAIKAAKEKTEKKRIDDLFK